MSCERRYLRLDTEFQTLDYENGDGFFTVKLHHGGFIQYEPKFEFVGSKVNFYDYCNVDYMSLLEFEDMCETLGYSGKVDVYYMDLSGCMFKVTNDRILQGIVGKSEKRVFIFFVDHGNVQSKESNVVENQEAQNTQTSVVINYDLLKTFEALPPFEDSGPSRVRNTTSTLIDTCNIDDFDWADVVVFPTFDEEKEDEFDSVANESVNESESDNEGSESDKSIDLEYFGGSDYDANEDDRLFDANVDKNEEWAGLDDKSD